MRRKISQREAHRNYRRLRELENRLAGLTNRYASDWPGTPIGTLPNQSAAIQFMVNTARALGAGVAVKVDGDVMKFYAVKP